MEKNIWVCHECKAEVEVVQGTPAPNECPECGEEDLILKS